ncbi:MAG: MG2 domain-containing protein [Bacteroidales bacterium]|nr:MG2 domain-containing protein [Bacteroidales bacterium]
MKTILKLLSAFIFLFALTSNLNAQNMRYYEQKWDKIDSLDKKGLPKSALKVINEIYTKAKKEKNSEQVLKSFIYNLKYKNDIEENAFESLCFELDSTAKEAAFPDNAIMNTMLADMYWWYYSNNRRKFYNRTNTVNFDNNDMQTWTLDYLVHKMIDAYSNSLSDKDALQKISVEEYRELISSGTKHDNLRPTLYDFLAHKAIDFFSNTEISLTKPADNYELKEDFYFSEMQDFISKSIKSSDSLSLHFHAECILQDLLKFRSSKQKEEDALIDVDLKRLKFAYAHSVHNNKDELYLEALQKLEKKHASNSFSSEVSYEIAKYYNTLSNKYNPLEKETDKYKFYKRTAYEICENVIKRYSETNAADHCKRLSVQIRKHNLSFTTENIISSKSKFSARVSFRNINKLFIKVAKIDKNKYEKLSNRLYGEKLYDKLVINSEKIYEFSKNIPDDGDYNTHSVEIVLDALNKTGLYILFISDNENYSYNKAMVSYEIFTVSDISYVQQPLYNGSYRFFVADRKTGQPLKDVACQLWYSKYNYKLRKYIRVNKTMQYTDKDGFITVKSGNKRDYTYWNVDFRKGNDFLTTSNSIYLYERDNALYVSQKTHYFTDRAIYRPGQTVYFKGISISSEGNKHEVIKNNSGMVTLYDVNNQQVADLEVRTNEYGTFSGSFDIPLGLINGQFHIEGLDGSKYFSVEEYKRPKFEVEMLPFKGNYLLNDDIKVEGKAISYSGAPISDGIVTFRVTRTPKWRGWWYWIMPTQSVEIANGTVVTDESGVFKINFKALPDLSMPENEFTYFRYEISVDVLDLNGETQSTSKGINIGYRALQVSLPLSGLINKNQKEIDSKHKYEYDIKTQNLNGEFIEASGKIKIFKLKDNPQVLKNKHWGRADKKLYTKEEWYKTFPGNLYDNENEQTELKKEEQVFMTKFNTKDNKKLNLSSIKYFASGYYVAEITSKDAFGNDVSNKHFFTVYNHEDKTMPVKMTKLFVPVKTYCEPGEEALFLIGSGYQGTKVIYQIEHKGKIVSQKILNINNEQKLIKIPVEEKHRGNFSVHFIFVKDNRLYNSTSVIYVPYSNKKLDIEFMTFRDKLYPGQKEEWKIKIKGPKGEKVAAEMLATLYDASLDQFKKNYWNFSIYNSYYSNCSWSTGTFTSANSTLLKKGLDLTVYAANLYYDSFNWFGFSYYSYGRGYTGRIISKSSRSRNGKYKKESEANEESYDADESIMPAVSEEDVAEIDDVVTTSTGIGREKKDKKPGRKDKIKQDFSNVKVRTNFNETAFFYPHLQTNDKGEVIISFTIPESLTKWKMMGFATTEDLKYGFINEELVTQKDLMLMPNSPRFFREFDKITFPVKISNISKEDINGQVQLEFFDAITMQPLDNILIKSESKQKNFSVKAGSNSLVSWKLEIPEGLGAITYKVVAKSEKFSDGEQKPVPVLTNRMLVTESLPLPVRGKGKTEFKFEKLINSGSSSSIKHHKLTLEFTSNPAWYAVQALPYLMEYPYECTEQTFSRFYANSIASHIANSNPKIKRVFDSWKEADAGALISNLEKNQELKAVLLEETPWVLQGKDESERKKRVGLLFDLNKMSNELNRALKKVQNAQKSNGAWPWFDGMPESRYITQHIVTGMGHLDKLGVKSVRQDSKTWNMLRKAVGYLDVRIKEDYNWLKRHYTKKELEKNHLSYTAIQYLYGRSYFNDIQIPNSTKDAYEYYMGQSKKYWLSQSKYMQGMIALALHRSNTVKTGIHVEDEIVNSLKEKSTDHPEMGMYWVDNVGGWYWYQAPIEQQALMIEVFDEVANDTESVNALKIWLLKQKQTQDWKTTKATTEAVYALLMRGSDWLVSDKQVKIEMNGKHIDPTKLDNVKVEAGTGYFKTSWSGGEIKPEMGNVTVTKYDEGVSWGALYWQYFEDLDKITPHETPLKLKKQLFIEKLTERGKVIEPISDKAKLKIGDKVIVRIELRVDRRMEYIHMKDMRASGFEPINVISRYKWQDGLGYYESTKDASTNFFMEALPKGTYVFEYPLRVTHEGNFSNGITTIQCMYAPEFTSHSEGIRVDVKK